MSHTTTKTVYFSGKYIDVTVTNNASTVDSWVRNIRSMYPGQQLIVGLDSEWRPNYAFYENNKTAVLQLCVDTKCLILQLFHLNQIPNSLRDFLGDRNFTFVGVEVARDAEKLRREYGLSCASVADVRDLAMERWPNKFYRKPGLKDVANVVVGLIMEKEMSVCRSDWETRVLGEKQIEYACIDAYASYRIGKKLFE